jgi:hypothetical protein
MKAAGAGTGESLVLVLLGCAAVIGFAYIFADDPERFVGYGIAAAIGAVAVLALSGQL